LNVVAVALCDYQVVPVKEIASFTNLTWFARDKRSPANAELRGKVAIPV
jgi:hypothetical protein